VQVGDEFRIFGVDEIDLELIHARASPSGVIADER
jgi:hypothetical protein